MSLALLTGSTGVLGRKLVPYLAKSYKLILHYRSSDEVLKELLSDSAVRKSLVKVVKWDFSTGSLEDFIRKVLDAGMPSLVILSASYYDSTPLARVSEELFNYLVKVNLVAPSYIALRIGREMSDGLIVFLTDMIAISGHEVYAEIKPSLPYVASRGSLQYVVKHLAKELAPRVRVIGIAVGWIENPRASRKLREAAIRSIPTKTFVTPDEIYLAIELAVRSPNLNGVFLTLSGGL
ncbi:MAG: SDR family NAD(P)-dependent oxidoreductase [Sulfolobales archaeon]|nr:SDR family NAD(P)-dependent oxidoreductase [Sulfolobales archaeon]MDW8083098.1 SDR family NAD(P)-dependent oxidoreductase [Sulfolobales archaeon]